MNIKDSNIAIVHDWFLQKSFGGAEKVSFILNDFLKERYSAPDIFSLTSNIESSEIKSLMKIPESYQLLGFVTAGIEGKASSIKKNVPKKKITHYEYFNK